MDMSSRSSSPPRPRFDPNGPAGGQRHEARSSPGEILRAARLRRRVSLADAEQATRIRQQYLRAIEDDDYGALPPGVYWRGFIRNYAIYLGVPPDEVLIETRARRIHERAPAVHSIASRPTRIRAPRATWYVALAGLVTSLTVAFLIWLGLTAPSGSPRAGDATSPVPGATTTALVQLPPLATQAPTPVPVASPTVAATPTAAGARVVDVELRTTDRTWVRAVVDGRLSFEETLAAGQVRRLTGQQSVALRVGNAAGVDITVNGQRIGSLGGPGQPVDREFTR